LVARTKSSFHRSLAFFFKNPTFSLSPPTHLSLVPRRPAPRGPSGAGPWRRRAAAAAGEGGAGWGKIEHAHSWLWRRGFYPFCCLGLFLVSLPCSLERCLALAEAGERVEGVGESLRWVRKGRKRGRGARWVGAMRKERRRRRRSDVSARFAIDGFRKEKNLRPLRPRPLSLSRTVFLFVSSLVFFFFVREWLHSQPPQSNSTGNS